MVLVASLVDEDDCLGHQLQRHLRIYLPKKKEKKKEFTFQLICSSDIRWNTEACQKLVKDNKAGAMRTFSIPLRPPSGN